MLSGLDGNEVDDSHQQFQEIIDQKPKKDILVEQGGKSVKVGRDA